MREMTREAKLELARRQQDYQWRRTREALKEFAGAVANHSPEDAEQAQDLADKFGMLADIAEADKASPQDFKERREA